MDDVSRVDRLIRLSELFNNRLDHLDLHMLAVLSILEHRLGVTEAEMTEFVEASRKFINDKLSQLPEKEENNAKDNRPTESGINT